VGKVLEGALEVQPPNTDQPQKLKQPWAERAQFHLRLRGSQKIEPQWEKVSKVETYKFFITENQIVKIKRRYDYQM